MKTIIPLLLLSMLTACSSVPQVSHVSQKTATNPEGLKDSELVQAQQARIDKLEREMERREMQMKFDHLKELQTVQIKQAQPAPGHVSCKLLCF
jgi:hypothetical protein